MRGQSPSGAPESNKPSYKTMLLALLITRGTPSKAWQVTCAVPFGVIFMVRGKGQCVGMDVGLRLYMSTGIVHLCQSHGRKRAVGECSERDNVVEQGPRSVCNVSGSSVVGTGVVSFG